MGACLSDCWRSTSNARHASTESEGDPVRMYKRPSQRSSQSLTFFSPKFIETVGTFFDEHMNSLDAQTQKKIGQEILEDLSSQDEEIKLLFTQKNVSAKLMMNMISNLGWLVKMLQTNRQSAVVPALEKMGRMHEKMNVKKEFYKPFIASFHHVMCNNFPVIYTTRVRFCMDSLYTIASAYMTNQDIVAVVSQSSTYNLEDVIGSLSECIEDERGFDLITNYLINNFCPEMAHFLTLSKKYHGLLNAAENGQECLQMLDCIRTECIEVNSHAEVNVSHATRNETLSAMKAVSEETIFEKPDALLPSYKEVCSLVETQHWMPFVNLLIALSDEEHEFVHARTLSSSKSLVTWKAMYELEKDAMEAIVNVES